LDILRIISIFVNNKDITTERRSSILPIFSAKTLNTINPISSFSFADNPKNYNYEYLLFASFNIYESSSEIFNEPVTKITQNYTIMLKLPSSTSAKFRIKCPALLLTPSHKPFADDLYSVNYSPPSINTSGCYLIILSSVQLVLQYKNKDNKNSGVFVEKNYSCCLFITINSSTLIDLLTIYP
jgi:hypothetical protein